MNYRNRTFSRLSTHKAKHTEGGQIHKYLDTDIDRGRETDRHSHTHTYITYTHPLLLELGSLAWGEHLLTHFHKSYFPRLNTRHTEGWHRHTDIDIDLDI